MRGLTGQEWPEKSWTTTEMPQFSTSLFDELFSNDCDLISSHEDLNENLEDSRLIGVWEMSRAIISPTWK